MLLANRITHSHCSERNHCDGDRRQPVIVGLDIEHERPLPLLFFVEALAKCFEDGVCKELTLSNSQSVDDGYSGSTHGRCWGIVQVRKLCEAARDRGADMIRIWKDLTRLTFFLLLFKFCGDEADFGCRLALESLCLIFE